MTASVPQTDTTKPDSSEACTCDCCGTEQEQQAGDAVTAAAAAGCGPECTCAA